MRLVCLTLIAALAGQSLCAQTVYDEFPHLPRKFVASRLEVSRFWKMVNYNLGACVSELDAYGEWYDREKAKLAELEKIARQVAAAGDEEDVIFDREIMMAGNQVAAAAKQCGQGQPRPKRANGRGRGRGSRGGGAGRGGRPGGPGGLPGGRGPSGSGGCTDPKCHKGGRPGGRGRLSRCNPNDCLAAARRFALLLRRRRG